MEGDIQSAEDQLMAENEFLRIYEMAEDVAALGAFNGNTAGTILPAEAILSFSDSSFTDGSPVVFTIDFGVMDSLHPAGMVCTDGKYRSGKIEASLSAPFSRIGSVISVKITAAHEYHSGNGIQMQHFRGDESIERTDSMSVRLKVTDGIVKHSLGSLNWSADLRLQKLSDEGPGWWNDRYEMRGTSSGINVNGNEFEVEITAPLLREFKPGCYQTFVQGGWTLKDARGNSMTADYDAYGDGACDRKLILKWNSFSRLIELW
jgi:hypothetical protein